VKQAVPVRGLKAAYVLTVLTMVLLVVVSAGGVFGSGWLYRDNALITATFRGQDWVTLLVAVPLLGAGLLLELRGSLRGRLLWLGMLFNAMYSYLFYAVARRSTCSSCCTWPSSALPPTPSCLLS
jgi:hypothetical protein